jgi:hypothetical protein
MTVSFGLQNSPNSNSSPAVVCFAPIDTPGVIVVTAPPDVHIGDQFVSAEFDPNPTNAMPVVEPGSEFGNAFTVAYIPTNDRCVATAAGEDMPNRIHQTPPHFLANMSTVHFSILR